MKPRILIAPLDWGLGHATRCIPIIQELLRRDAEVIIGADNRPLDLLKKEFPTLEYIRFPGYAVRYVEKGNLDWAIAKQLPSILKGFKVEHKKLDGIINQYKIDAVISDSRYGVHSHKIPSVFVIHQLQILLPSRLHWAQGSVASINKMFINRFDECWIPDFHGEKNLAGILSHPRTMPNKTFYVGPLSRLKKIDRVQKDFDVLVILSGPEPQRTIFEEIIIEQLRKTSYRAFIVRGIPEHATRIKLTDNITAVSALTADELAHTIAVSKIIVSRPGYSTIMDLSFTGVKAIFVPTPQQTEQEYLATIMKQKKIFYSEKQNEFNLERALTASREYSGFSSISDDDTALSQCIENILSKIEKRN
ncbi:MAG: glycosyltransferase [Bacteroidota bacterium]|nr:glycosyltransferase [Bacteroidota bacterium]